MIKDAAKLFIGLCKEPNTPALYWRLLYMFAAGSRAKNAELFENSKVGKRVLEEKVSLIDYIDNITEFKEGSVAEYYRAYCTYWEIDTREYFALGSYEATNTNAFLLQRMLASHELLHITLGYDSSLKGEMQVAMFQFSQSRNLGFLLIALSIAWRYASSPALLLSAYRKGQRLSRIEILDWETILGMQVREVRSMFC